jgi:RNA polymerase sigma-70 factor (ECF subfamily)
MSNLRSLSLAPAPAAPVPAVAATPDYPDDYAAVRAAQRGDTAAFAWLVRRHQRRAVAVAIGLLHDREDARDACQEAFLRAYRALASFDGQAQFNTWLHRILVNLCIDRLRRPAHGLVALDDVDDLLASEDDPARRAEDAELGGRLGVALRQLSDSHRTTLVLRELQGFSYQEIADAMRCSIGTVMSRLFHARRRMQALLGAERPEDALAA